MVTEQLLEILIWVVLLYTIKDLIKTIAINHSPAVREVAKGIGAVLLAVIILLLISAILAPSKECIYVALGHISL